VALDDEPELVNVWLALVQLPRFAVAEVDDRFERFGLRAN
jgi:hypothetical protein